MPKPEVILTHNIVGLGAESDQVKVAPGYARNFLIPQRLAIPLTQANRRHLDALKQRRADREAHEFNTMTELSKSLSKLVCVIKVKTGEDGKMFGAVTAGMIADELKHQFDVTLEKRKIHLEHSIRTIGDHDVELHLHGEVKSILKVRVESTTPAPTPAVEAAPADAKAERRVKRSEKNEAPAAEEAKPRAAKGEKGAKSEKAAKGEKSAKA